MTKLTYIKSLLKLIFSKKKKWELQTGHTVDVAFWSGGKPYYKLSDLFNTFTERGLDAYQTYEEIGMRIEVTALKEFVSKFKSDLNTGKLMDCAITLNFLEERVNFVIPPRNLIYKLASVAYFDETESPYTYDTIYANRKMDEIRKNGDVDDFFLYSLPLASHLQVYPCHAQPRFIICSCIHSIIFLQALIITMISVLSADSANM